MFDTHSHHHSHETPDHMPDFHQGLSDEVKPGQDFWQPRPPLSADLGDHEVPRNGDCLEARQIALLVSGGIAAFKAPLLARELRRYGAEVTVFVSQEALRYVTLDALAWSSKRPVIQELSHRAEHLGDGRRFDAYILAPATYNTINKFRHGMADSLLSTVLASALGRLQQGKTQILIAPTMHGSMHNPLLEESLLSLQELGVTVIPPRDAYGKHNLPEAEEIVYRCARALSDSPLRGVPVLLTGGPTPVYIDAIRRITTGFSGKLAYELAKALFVAGAELHWVQGPSALQIPGWLPYQPIDNFDEYYQSVLYLLDQHQCRAGIFAAAVADYRPELMQAGKIPSGAEELNLRLKPTAKVIQQVRKRFPELEMVSFKFEAGMSHEQLMEIAQSRLARGYQAVLANRHEEQQPDHIGWLVQAQGVQRLQGKAAIARGIVSYLEQRLFAAPEEL